MASINETMNKSMAFNNQDPSYLKGNGLKRAGRTGQGLTRTGRVGGGPAIAAALGSVAAPILGEIGKEVAKGIPWIGKKVVSGIAKAGKWIGKLFGFGMLEGGFYRNPYGPDDAIYHDFDLTKVNRHFYDLPEATGDRKLAKYENMMNKFGAGLEGGSIKPFETAMFFKELQSNPKFATKLGSLHKKPHKLVKYMFNHMNRAQKKAM